MAILSTPNAPSDPDHCAEELARLLSQQAVVCKDILELSRKQQSLVEERKEGELLVLLSEKQKIINRHQELSNTAKPLRDKWEGGMREKSGAQAHAKVEKAWNNLREVLDEIVRLEDASREVLQKAHGKVAEDITKLQRGKIANKAYGGGMRIPPQARFSDKKG